MVADWPSSTSDHVYYTSTVAASTAGIASRGKIVLGCILCFLTAFCASMSGGFRIVSDTLVYIKDNYFFNLLLNFHFCICIFIGGCAMLGPFRQFVFFTRCIF